MKQEATVAIVCLLLTTRAFCQSPLGTASVQYMVTDLGTISETEGTAGGPSSFDPNKVAVGSILDKGIWRAVLYHGSKAEVIDPKAAQDSHAFGTNSRGQVVGDYGTLSHPVMWEGSKRQDLDMLPDTVSGSAVGINGSGVAIGNCNHVRPEMPAVSDSFPCVFDHDKVHELKAFGFGGYAYSINDQGDIVGCGVVEPSRPIFGDYAGTEPVCHAVLWSGDRHLDLGRLPGKENSSAASINNAGLIVGESDGSAVLWCGKQIYDLNTLIPPKPAWRLSSASGANEQGCITVVGRQILSHGRRLGEEHRLLLTPKPSSSESH